MSGVLLARVSLNERMLAVTDHRGVIVLVSEDASWALGATGPASSLVGSSLLDHLTDEDKIEYKNAMRRRSGSLLRLRHQGCFVWLDISHHPHVTPRLKRALHRVERARAPCSCNEKPTLRSSPFNHSGSGDFPHKQHPPQGQQQQQQHPGGQHIGLHVLSKERPLEWFLEPAPAGSESEDEDGSCVEAAAAADSLECLSLRSSESSSSASSSSSSSGATGEFLAADWDPASSDDHQQQQQQQFQQQQQQADAKYVREYSFRDIFEYALSGGRPSSCSRQGSRASNLNLAGGGAASDSAPPATTAANGGRSSSSGMNAASAAAAAARAVAAVALRAGQPRDKRSPYTHTQQQASASGRASAKAREGVEGSPAYHYSSSWRVVGGYMAQRAAATVAGLSAGGSSSLGSGTQHHHHHHAGQGGDDAGWGFFVDCSDIVG